MGRRSWSDLKRERLAALQHEAGAQETYRAGYEHARRAFELGEQVRKIREEQHITQGELAEKAGTSQPAIARLEAGGAEPKLDTLERIGRALGMDLVVRFELPTEQGTLVPA